MKRAKRDKRWDNIPLEQQLVFCPKFSDLKHTYPPLPQDKEFVAKEDIVVPFTKVEGPKEIEGLTEDELARKQAIQDSWDKRTERLRRTGTALNLPMESNMVPYEKFRSNRKPPTD